VLAVQNIEASGSVIKPLELEFNALTGSLTVMSKGPAMSSYRRCDDLTFYPVLNDVLDLNRMDAGKFEVSIPILALRSHTKHGG
jgi:osomolarity two-component system, sensor histidine kinase SLN1